MKKLAMFVPLVKADAAQRLVYGAFDETPDAAREVFDYASSKPLFQAWSEKLDKASDGKSLGNIRAQHNPQIAAGKLVSMIFDDRARAISFCAHIVDDAEWRKVEEGVYTGFSPGGSYARRWRDGAHMRYTADPCELSIVDVPCNPNATFTLVKADGTEAEIALLIGRAYEPGNEATKSRAEALAKAAGPDERARDYVVQARAQLIAEQAAVELGKMAVSEKDDEVSAVEADTPADEPEADVSQASEPRPDGKPDAALIQSVHDDAVKLGARCGEAKAPEPSEGGVVAQDNERLSKALGEMTPQLEALTKTVAALTADRSRDQEIIGALRQQIEDYESQPVLAKGVRLAPEKGADSEVPAKDGNEGPDLIARLGGEKNPAKRAQIVLGHEGRW